jgi:hypothetical protein
MELSPQILQERLQAMPDDQVKLLMMAWLQDDLLVLQQFTSWVETTQPELKWGQIDSDLNFQPLTDDEMIAQSLATLRLYQTSAQGISQNKMTAWAESLGTDYELPCPQ